MYLARVQDVFRECMTKATNSSSLAIGDASDHFSPGECPSNAVDNVLGFSILRTFQSPWGVCHRGAASF